MPQRRQHATAVGATPIPGRRTKSRAPTPLVGTVQEPLAGAYARRGVARRARVGASRQLGHALLQLPDFLPQLRLRPVRAIETDDGARRGTKPPTCGRSRDAAPRGEAELARASDEFPEPMAVTLLPA